MVEYYHIVVVLVNVCARLGKGEDEVECKRDWCSWVK